MKWATRSFGVWMDEDVAVSNRIWGRGNVIMKTGEREKSVRRAKVGGREYLKEKGVVKEWGAVGVEAGMVEWGDRLGGGGEGERWGGRLTLGGSAVKIVRNRHLLAHRISYPCN